jgi:beta-mannosidase
MLLGRTPSFAPGPPVIGPWRPVRVGPRPAGRVTLWPRVLDGDGLLAVAVETGGVVEVQLTGPTGSHAASFAGGGGELRIAGVERWWPHTHGSPTLYEARVTVDGTPVPATPVGFRELSWNADWERDGLGLRVNGTPVFCRGAVWTPRDLTLPHAPREELRRVLETVAGAGMNMLRIPGIACYESDDFHDLCDELGLLVWQDFMFANLDYPDQDPAFLEAVEQEARDELGRLAGRPSLAVLCGGSEVAQQVTMLGLDPALARGPLYTEVLPRAVAESGAGVPYVPNTPWGGDVPFRTDVGVANYYGVGAYLRPLADARLAEVRFAAECLAFSNVPDDAALSEIAGASGAALVPHHPAWKAGVPRDRGAGWDFEDVRDHYLKVVYGQDAVGLRWADPARYLELSRAVSGEVMAEVFGEWRRAGSPCGGALVLWLADLKPGAGWGVLDHRGAPKVVYHYLRRALAPIAVWTTDEGLGGVTAHVANDGDRQLDANLRLSLYRDAEILVEQANLEISLGAGSLVAHNVEAVLGRFVDVGWAYRFGPPAVDVIVASLESASEQGTTLLSETFRFPVGWPERREPASGLGLAATVAADGDGNARLAISSRRLAYCVRIDAPGFTPADDAFSIAPGGTREVVLRRDGAAGDAATPAATLTALNLAGRVKAVSP